MASKTQQTENCRARKAQKSGAKRKKQDRNKGSTPKFAIHQQQEKKK